MILDKSKCRSSMARDEYFLRAREIILRHVFGRPPGRRTLDVDLGIAVRDWDHFKMRFAALATSVRAQVRL